ncbi:porin [uncultured Muribaculum sp.]|uniref:porin n=1 Tax=uncultured Muribaculum sp. TaxID=1918613 RepID=UPI00266F0B2B|nr:porin [uncultured Muribaculum sp.]
MKKIFALALCSIAMGSTMAYAEETEAQAEMNGYIQDGLAKFTSSNGLYSFRVGARAFIDGSYYFDDYTDRGSGANISSARVRVFSKLGNHFDFKFDVDFMSKGNMLKDVYLRWHSNKNGFFMLGNFIEPFSAENIQTTMNDPFITKSATVQAFGTGRRVGVSYRYYHPYFWGEAGAFSQAPSQEYVQGDKGYSLSARLLGRYTSEDFNIHAGGSINWSRPDAQGITNGSDDYNRSIVVGTNLESAVDKLQLAGATINNVSNVLKFGFEVMANYRNVYFKGEYIGAHYDRERDWNYNFQNALGTFMGSMFPTISAYKALMGEDTKVKFYGVSVEAGVLVLGGDYKYNRVNALMNRPGGKTLELIARFNHTNLNDILPGSWWAQGARGAGFYTSSLHQAFGITNGSVSGGRLNTFTFGVNYYITNSVVARLDYNYAHLNHKYSLQYCEDKNLHSLQARLAFEF